MTKFLRMFLMVTAAIAVLTGTAAAYESEEYPVKTIIIEEGGKDIVANTKTDTVRELLEEYDVFVDEYTVVSKGLDEQTVGGEVIKIKQGLNITFSINGEKIKVKTHAKTVEEVINENIGLIGDGYTLLDYKLSSRIADGITIRIEPADKKIIIAEEPIPFETKYIETTALPEGKEIIVQFGKDGIAQNSKKVSMADGQIVSSEILYSKVITPPVEQIIRVGAKTDGTVEYDINLATLNFAYAIDMNASAYTPYDEGCNGITATGVKARYGIAAVDTNVIPFGTQLYIPGYGFAVAADRGGAIKGNKIDLCYESLSDALKFGRKNLTVYVLAE